jgi:Ca2+-transporting ATPase
MPDTPHAMPPDEVLCLMQTTRKGLEPVHHQKELARYGRNLLVLRRPRPIWAILIHQVRGLVTWLLIGAALVSVVTGDRAEALAVAVVLILNTAIGFGSELRATRSIEALARMAESPARVRRGGRVQIVDARTLVPGDIVLLEAGDVVSADMRLLELSGLHCDESILTGEAQAVAKDCAPVPEMAEIPDRRNMLFKGARITQGSAEAVVIATGMATEMGRIAALVQSTGRVVSPLEEQLDGLGARLVWLMLGLCAVIMGVGVLRGLPASEILRTGVALAVAAIPEGLPVVATLSLARGMWQMLERGVLVRRLTAVETLGATTLILTDKTGTLTANRMKVVRVLTADGDFQTQGPDGLPAGCGPLHVAGRLAAVQIGNGPVRDPMDQALAAFAQSGGISPRVSGVRFHAFDPRRRMAAGVFAEKDDWVYAVRGAPEAILRAVTHMMGDHAIRPLDETTRVRWHARLAKVAGQGQRCLALATKTATRPDLSPFQGLTLVAIVAMEDPIRSDVPDALAACRAAGIRVAMVTGDHVETAAAIAAQAGIGQGPRPAVLTGRALREMDFDDAARLARTDVFARVLPEDKMRLVDLFRARGEVVAMTGDGVNDAPALAKADIGIAMGRRGTQVARETADMVLQDDSFGAIVAAIREGRIIHENIRNFVMYLMSCNLSEVLFVGGAVLIGLPAPLSPLQILFLNLVTDVFPAFALGLGQGSDRVLQDPPRLRSAPLVTQRDWQNVAVLAIGLTCIGLAAFVAAFHWLDLAQPQAVSVAFLTVSLGQVWNVFNIRPAGSTLWNFINKNNLNVFYAIIVCVAMISAAMFIPALSLALHLPFPGWWGIALGVLTSLGALVLHPLMNRVQSLASRGCSA